eukprot:Selendium_serpulae@DN2813_c0_g1_i1.p1
MGLSNLTSVKWGVLSSLQIKRIGHAHSLCHKKSLTRGCLAAIKSASSSSGRSHSHSSFSPLNCLHVRRSFSSTTNRLGNASLRVILRVDMGEYAAVITAILLQTNARIWFDRVSSENNPADGLSRCKPIEMESEDISHRVETRLPEAMALIKEWIAKKELLRAENQESLSHDDEL